MREQTRRVLSPLVATTASALASYVAKKGPQYLEQSILPRLLETAPSPSHDGEAFTTNDEPARRRRERAERRAARRKAS